MVQDIIWYAPNKMPESVTTRCAKSHEHIFLMAKANGYYFDSEAIRQPAAENNRPHKYKRSRPNDPYQEQDGDRSDDGSWGREETANKRDVWVVPTQGYRGAHFAVFSPKLIEPCILAGTSEHGCCAECRKPYERVVVKTGEVKTEPNEDRDRSFEWSRNGKTGSLDGVHPRRDTVGWRKMCGCLTDEVMPCIVLDPFVGSGTTVATAMQLGRAGIGIDLSETYLTENAIPRIELVANIGIERKNTVAVSSTSPPPIRKLRGQ